MNNFTFADINLFAVLVAWIIHIVLGLSWFQPKLFGNAWFKLTGKELKPANKWIIPGLLGHLTMVFTIAINIKIGNIVSGLSGLLIGFLGWIGYVVPLETGELIWEKIPFKLFLIRIRNQFIGIGISAFILSAWQ